MLRRVAEEPNLFGERPPGDELLDVGDDALLLPREGGQGWFDLVQNLEHLPDPLLRKRIDHVDVQHRLENVAPGRGWVTFAQPEGSQHMEWVRHHLPNHEGVVGNIQRASGPGYLVVGV